MQKLREQKGATILMALLLILLATMVSALILVAAVSATRRMTSDREAQQNYLAVSSAAELLRESIRTNSYTKRVYTTTTETESTDENGSTNTSRDVQVSETEDLPNGLLGRWLTDGARNGGCSETTITVTVQGDEGSAIPTVYARFSMDASYNVKVKLSLTGGTEDADEADCRMTLALEGDVNEETRYFFDPGVTTQIDTTVISWKNPQITKGITEGT